ncbi:MAG: hypothetical protein RMJ43_15785 [Chloroherpetonaceae bacterium]|nr:hypothetical protein [Chthonomonadaceae bacterium]MDW8209295.1 hypothetical protein [Chloroherpetonaceae bacterium]
MAGVGVDEAEGERGGDGARDLLDGAGHPFDVAEEAAGEGADRVDGAVVGACVPEAAHLHGDVVAEGDGFVLRQYFPDGLFLVFGGLRDVVADGLPFVAAGGNVGGAAEGACGASVAYFQLHVRGALLLELFQGVGFHGDFAVMRDVVRA